MLTITTRFNKGDKVFTVNDLAGIFEIAEVEIIGFVYQDFEVGKPPVVLYVFNLSTPETDGKTGKSPLKFAKDDILFNTREEAIEKIKKMLPEYEETYKKETDQLLEQVKNLNDAKDKLVSSAQNLILSKLI